MSSAAQRSVPHVAFVDANFDSVYGGQRRMLVLAAALASTYRVSVVTTSEGRLAESARAAGVDVTILPAHPSVNRFGGAIARARAVDQLGVAGRVLGWTARFARWARTHGVRVAVANDLRSCLMCGPGARATKIPLIWSVRDDTRTGRFQALGARLATCVVTVSAGTQHVFDDRQRRRLGRRLRTIHNGIPFAPPGSFDASRLRSLLGPEVDRTTPTLALVGMVTPRKGHLDAVRALARLRDHHQLRAHLAIIGDAPVGYADHEEHVRRTIDELGLASSVSWLGFRSDAVELMSGADLVVLPSRNEGLPGVLIEALGVGTPVVTYACSGADEIVRDGATGSVVPIGDESAFATAVAWWLTRPEQRRQAGAVGAADVRQRFSVAAYAQAYGALLEELIGRPAVDTGRGA